MNSDTSWIFGLSSMNNHRWCQTHYAQDKHVFVHYSPSQRGWELASESFAWEFSQLLSPGQTRRKVACELMRVDAGFLPRVQRNSYQLLSRFEPAHAKLMRVQTRAGCNSYELSSSFDRAYLMHIGSKTFKHSGMLESKPPLGRLYRTLN
jgi:hypothetical protein